MIGMQVRNKDFLYTLKALPVFTHLYLCSFTGIDQEMLFPEIKDLCGREAFGSGQGTAGSEYDYFVFQSYKIKKPREYIPGF